MPEIRIAVSLNASSMASPHNQRRTGLLAFHQRDFADFSDAATRDLQEIPRGIELPLPKGEHSFNASRVRCGRFRLGIGDCIALKPLAAPVADRIIRFFRREVPVIVRVGPNRRFDAMSRMNFSISLAASPSNCVEVSVGEDANGDGVLSLDETDQTFGYNCGMWFQRDVVADEVKVIGEDEQWNSRLEKTFVLKKRKLDEAWNLVKVTRRGKAEVCELATVEGAKPGAALIVR